jgi:hypothetical protein
MVTVCECHNDDSTPICGCWTITSTAPAVAVWVPDAGGRFTATENPFTPSTNP